MKARPKSATSTASVFEQKFEKQQLYKRNKRYLNLNRKESIQIEHSILRRTPLGTDEDHLSHKFQSSFMNSTTELTERLDRDIEKFKSRVSLSARGTSTQLRTPNSPAMNENQPELKERSFSESARSFSIEKMTSRQYHYDLHNKPCPDERQFNNFAAFSPSAPLACSFGHMRGKVLDNTIYHLNDIHYDTQQLYQQYYYSNASTLCKVNYKDEKKQPKGRRFFHAKRPENLPATELSPHRVDAGARAAPHFKASNLSTNAMVEFYRESSKDVPSQMDMRRMNELTNHWIDESGRIPRKKLDYSTRKMKEDMVCSRQDRMKDRKKAVLDQSEMCDTKYYKYHRK